MNRVDGFLYWVLQIVEDLIEKREYKRNKKRPKGKLTVDFEKAMEEIFFEEMNKLDETPWVLELFKK